MDRTEQKNKSGHKWKKNRDSGKESTKKLGKKKMKRFLGEGHT